MRCDAAIQFFLEQPRGTENVSAKVCHGSGGIVCFRPPEQHYWKFMAEVEKVILGCIYHKIGMERFRSTSLYGDYERRLSQKTELW